MIDDLTYLLQYLDNNKINHIVRYSYTDPEYVEISIWDGPRKELLHEMVYIRERGIWQYDDGETLVPYINVESLISFLEESPDWDKTVCFKNPS